MESAYVVLGLVLFTNKFDDFEIGLQSSFMADIDMVG